MNQVVTYAIGDVHGEADRLAQLHTTLLDRHALHYPEARARLIHLGDYVDRGPDSAGVIERVIGLSEREDVDVIALAGNHEAMMLNALADETASDYRHWLRNGGEETLKSYADRGYANVPSAHTDWIRSLPTIQVDDAERRIFVHAGLRPREFPHENTDVHLWTRAADFFETRQWQDTPLEGWTVIHGHTPTQTGWPEDHEQFGRRINIDTGAVFGGRLTCAVFVPNEDVRYLYA